MNTFDLAVGSDVPVLISGPTGSGKTLLAQRIHEGGARRARPFVVVNLASLHEGTFESELFGHERGAFTGADSKRLGRLELANGGTLFLDEIGELPLRLQARLLEFLQSKTLVPVGGNREVRLDVRVIAASHRDLVAMVRDGLFREDLFHRLRFLSVELPGLSSWDGSRFSDLVHELIQTASKSVGKAVHRLSAEFAQRLEGYSWPGNIRELKTVLEFSVLALPQGSTEITTAQLPPWFGVPVSPAGRVGAPGRSQDELASEQARLNDFYGSLALFEKAFLERALRRNRGGVNRTAREIGMNKTTLIRRMRALGLSIDQMEWR
jgi:transcriptional regulator with PAS, ATPase and Fis domain